MRLRLGCKAASVMQNCRRVLPGRRGTPGRRRRGTHQDACTSAWSGRRGTLGRREEARQERDMASWWVGGQIATQGIGLRWFDK